MQEQVRIAGAQKPLNWMDYADITEAQNGWAFDYFREHSTVGHFRTLSTKFIAKDHAAAILTKVLHGRFELVVSIFIGRYGFHDSDIIRHHRVICFGVRELFFSAHRYLSLGQNCH